MPESRIDFRYTAGDVTSAQRTRFLKSPQFRTMLLFWLGSEIFLILHVLFPDTVRIFQGVNWQLVISITMVYIATLLVLVLITPFVDFAFNRFWRLPLSLYFSEKQLRLSVDTPAKKSTVKSAAAKGAGKSAKKTSSKAGDKSAEKPKAKSRSLDLDWDEVKQVHVDKRAYIVYYGPQSRFFVVPRSAFTAPGQEQRFRELLGERLKA